jgi:hypothetical protein
VPHSATWSQTILRSRPTTRYVRHALFSKLGLGVAPPPSPVETDTLLKRALGERDHLRQLRPQSAEHVVRGLPWPPLRVPLLGCRHCCLVRGECRLATALLLLSQGLAASTGARPYTSTSAST